MQVITKNKQKNPTVPLYDTTPSPSFFFSHHLHTSPTGILFMIWLVFSGDVSTRFTHLVNLRACLPSWLRGRAVRELAFFRYQQSYKITSTGVFAVLASLAFYQSPPAYQAL